MVRSAAWHASPGGDLPLEGTSPLRVLRAQSKQIKIEVEARLRRVDVLAERKSHSPTITGREQFDRAPSVDKPAVDHVIYRN